MTNLKMPEVAGAESSALGTSEREFVALACAWARHATPEQRQRAARFLGALSCEPAAAECAAESRARTKREREFEESQLHGIDLQRRSAEPA